MIQLLGMERSPITVTLPDGKEIEGTAWETTPLSIAVSLSKSLADRTVIAKVKSAPGCFADDLYIFAEIVHRSMVFFLI